MNSSGEVLVIDKLEHWREFSQATLRSAGFKVRALADYDCRLVSELEHGSLDLVILGCACVRTEELQLIQRVRASKLHLLVLCTLLRLRLMRSLFLLGADDVAQKPFDSTHLLNVVGHAMESILIRERHGPFLMSMKSE